jgi:hypothetical protein
MHPSPITLQIHDLNDDFS